MTVDPVHARRARRAEALRAAGITQAELAARIGVSRQSVGLVLADHHRSRRVEQAIADACGVAVAELFPSAEAPPRARETGGRGGDPGAREGARDTESQAVATRQVAHADLERDLNAELRAIVDRVLIAVAEGDLPADRPIVRAAAAAVRALAR